MLSVLFYCTKGSSKENSTNLIEKQKGIAYKYTILRYCNTCLIFRGPQPNRVLDDEHIANNQMGYEAQFNFVFPNVKDN